MLADAKACSERFAEEESIDVAFDKIWSIEPILFHPELIELCEEAIRQGRRHFAPAAVGAVARCGGSVARRIPTVMLFVQSLRGLSHTRLEDTKEEHLELAVDALDRLTTKTIAWLAS